MCACGDRCRAEIGLAYSARMIRRLDGACVAVTLTAIVLSACGSPAPTPTEPSTTATPSHAQPLTAEQAVTTFEAFYAAVDAQFAAGTVSVDELAAHATRDVAERWAGFIEEDLAAGQVSRGVLEVTAAEQDEVSADSIRVELCTDGQDIVTTDPQGLRIPPSGLVAWSAEFERGEDGLLLSALQPTQDQSICGL